MADETMPTPDPASEREAYASGLAARLWNSSALRFCIVGFINSGVDFAVFYFALRLGAAPILANVLGWMVAVVSSYVWNSRWTFDRDESLGDLRSILRFFSLGALISLGVSSIVLLSTQHLIGTVPAKLLGIAVAAVLNFFAARWSIENRFLQKKRPPEGGLVSVELPADQRE